MSFERFMELALYHPTEGYYTRHRSGAGPAGAEGDFLTAPTASPLFAETIAKLLRGLAGGAGEPVTFVELGSGEGVLLERLGACLGDEREQVLSRVIAIETGGWARERIGSHSPWVEVADRLDRTRTPTGPVVLFASELYDALPCRRVTMVRRGELLALSEWFVVVDEEGSLCWVLDDPADGAPEEYLAHQGVSLEEGQTVELRTALRSIHAGHLAWCGRNAVALVLDYGYPSRQLFNPRGRRLGSLTGYLEHARVPVEALLERPGEVDITAHVNFDDLESAASDVGWDRGEVRPMAVFLTIHGALGLLPERCVSGEPLTCHDWAELATAKRLLLPAGMGVDLKVLAQGRGPLWRVYRRLATPPPQGA